MNHWDEKFKHEDYIYGIEPSEWIRLIFQDCPAC